MKMSALLALFIANNAAMAFESEKTDDSLENILAKHCRFSGTFTQEKSLTGLPVPLNSSGQFLFDCDLGLIWHTATPIVETKVYTFSSLHYQLDEKLEIEPLDGVIQTTIAKLLLNIMSANKNAIVNNFSIIASDSNSVSLAPTSSFLKKGLQSVALKKDPTENALLIELVDKKSQNTSIRSVETQRSESKQSSLAHCKTLFKDESTCDIFENPSSYETSVE